MDLTQLLSSINNINCSNVDDAHQVLMNARPTDINVVLEEFPAAKIDQSETITGRFLLYTLNRGALHTMLHKQANGIVLLFNASVAPQWSVLVTPPLRFRTPYKFEGSLSDYEIYLMKDGTIVSLYYYNNQWAIATARSYCINEQIWASDVKYIDVVTEVLAKYNINMDDLDKTKSYYFGFHHPAYHPFTKEVYAWNIFKDNLLPIDNHVQVNSITLDEINNNNVLAMKRYVSSKEQTDLHYGYILRNGTDDVCLQSTLYNNIKKIYYVQPKLSDLKSLEKTNSLINKQFLYTRHTYVALRAYLNYKVKYVAQTLFPEFKPLYQRFDDFFNDNAIKILTIMDSKELYDKTFNKPTELNTNIHEQSLFNLVKTVITFIKKNGGINPSHVDSKSIVIDYLHDERYIYVYVNYLTFC